MRTLETAKAPPSSIDNFAAAKLAASLRSQLPVAQFEYVDVTFNATANANTDIRHSLSPTNPDEVDYVVVGWRFASAPATTPVIYRDTSATRRAAGTGYIVLRCNVASATATLLLTVRPTRSLP
jgi:hypothetical protein